MIPVSSNNITNGCNPISSNCVVWQGPDIPCINICNGDTVSDVVAKLATELCTLLDQTNLSALDLSCLNLDAQDVPVSFLELQQLLIDQLCSLGGRCTALEGSSGGTVPSEVTATLPACLQYTNQQNDLVTVLPLDEYAELVASNVCGLISDITTINSTLGNHETRITALENATPSGSTVPQVTPTCVLPSVLTDIDTVVEALEEQFCDLRTATGDSTALLSATSVQCSGLNTEDRLSGSGTMSSVSGWNTSVTNVAESLTNMWLTICDIRDAVKDIKVTCCTITCNDVFFTVSATYTSGYVTFDFSGSIIPSQVSECNINGATLVITDGLGHSFNTSVSVSTALAGNNTAIIDISGSSLDLYADYTATITLCVTDGSSLTCNKEKVLVIVNPDVAPSPTVYYYAIQNCVTPGSTIIASTTGTTLNIGQAVRVSHDGGADCWTIVDYGVSPATTTVLNSFTDCNACTP